MSSITGAFLNVLVIFIKQIGVFYFVFCSAVVNCWWLIGKNSHGKLEPLKLLTDKEQGLLDHCSHMSPPCLLNSCILKYYFHQSSAISFGKEYSARYGNCDFGSPLKICSLLVMLHFLIKFCTIASLEFSSQCSKAIFKNSFHTQYIKVW